MSNGYLDSLDRRMARVATTLSFLAAWQVRDGEDLWLRLKGAEASEKALVESALCRFETRMFHRIGEDLRRIAGQEGAWSDFLTVARPQVEAVDFFCPSLCQI
jgi:hypothetical protein